ncbi:MAG: alpha,alpha-trehalase TreF [Cyclobacteriaceae bacterium]
MNRFLSLFIIAVLSACSQQDQKQGKQPYQSGLYYPNKDLGQLFHDVQMQRIFPDGKTFVDYTPKYTITDINKSYSAGVTDLKVFVKENFNRFPEIDLPAIDNANLTLEEHLPNHWDYLTRQPDTTEVSGSLLPLPNPYVVPGGRFREVYYWDSYFTMLGLEVSGRVDLIKNMVDNFAYLIDVYGHIPNGNRTYYLSRSQPPFFSSMVMLLAEIEGVESVFKYRPQLEKEYAFWMNGVHEISENQNSANRVVKLGDYTLNRFWDDVVEPRPESYKEDFELGEQADDTEQLYRHLKAGAESGWDFSTRWFSDYENLSTIRTTDVLPIDLNCLLYHLESSIAAIYAAEGESDLADIFEEKADARKLAINAIFWNDELAYYTDYLWEEEKSSEFITAATAAPLFFEVADQQKADLVAMAIRDQLLLDGGVVTTLVESGQQWDFPNGWAPLQWMAIKGLLNYGHDDLAREIASRWMKINREVFAETGKMMEKYNVADLEVEAGGGEYPTQDGFGWTNGVALKIMDVFEGI